MQHEKDRFLHKGDQIGLIEFDQLETFTEKQFFYMLSRSRATRANIWPYIRATCNPVPEDDAVGGWLHTFVQWWIDAETGYAIPERSGVVRYMVRDGDRIEWGDSREELVERGYPAEDVLSVTFILATPYDNPIGLKRDPTYLTKVRSMARVDQERLLGDAKLGGNWNIRDTAGTLFSRDWFRYVDLAPAFVEAVRCWDRAATDEDSPNAARASRTAGALVGRDRDGVLYLRDMVCVQKDAHIVQQLLLDTARADGRSVEVAIFQDPGAAGKAEALATMRLLSREGFVVHILPTIPPRRTRDGNALEGPNAKVTYAKLWSPLVEKEQFRLVRGAWNREFVDEASNFDGTGLSDQVDAVSGAVHQLTSTARVFTF
jgi:predicted phage terminase large subunit-like protein